MTEKGILDFDLTDPSAAKAFARASKASEAYLVISDTYKLFRAAIKYGTFKGKELTEEEINLLEALREEIIELERGYGIDVHTELD